MKHRLKDIIRFIDETADEHMGAFSSQAAFFLFLSFFPLVNIAVALPTFLPISEEQMIKLIYYVLPAQFEGYVAGQVSDMYEHGSGSITIFSIVIAVWSAAKGIMSIRNGLNEIYRSREKKNYFFVRGISAIYTIVFILLLLLLIPLNMFGTQIAMYVIKQFPDYVNEAFLVYNLKSAATFVLLFIMFELLYTLVPMKKLKFRNQVPGALFSAAAWIIVTKLFSLYVDYYASKSYMYGSITTIIMIMFWLQLVIYLMFCGAQVNEYLYVKKDRDKKYELSKYSEEKTEVWEDDELTDVEPDSTEPVKSEKANKDEPVKAEEPAE